VYAAGPAIRKFIMSRSTLTLSGETVDRARIEALLAGDALLVLGNQPKHETHGSLQRFANRAPMLPRHARFFRRAPGAERM
jgi:hypothetical protein